MKADRVNPAYRHWLTWNQFLIISQGKKKIGKLIYVQAQSHPEVKKSLCLKEGLGLAFLSVRLFIFLKWRAAVEANEVEVHVLIYWSVCVCEWETPRDS